MVSSVFKLVLVHAILTGCGEAVAACAGVPGRELADVEADVKFALRTSTAVFSGKVVAIDYVRAQAMDGEPREAQVVRVAAQSWWKGPPSPTVTLGTDNRRRTGGVLSVEAHAYRYEVGKNYLIYAQLDDGRLHANGCTRTKGISAAAADIAILDALTTQQE